MDTFLADRPGDPRLLPLHDWSQIELAAVFYISLISEYLALADLRAQVPAPGCHVTLGEDIYTPATWWLELTSVQGTKADALTTLKNQVGAKTMICFGDNLNDLPMFAIADHAVAVSNATPDVQAAATEVIGSNDVDSVAHWIRAMRQPTHE